MAFLEGPPQTTRQVEQFFHAVGTVGLLGKQCLAELRNVEGNVIVFFAFSFKANNQGDPRCEQLISMPSQPQWPVPPFSHCQQARSGYATEIASARCVANNAFIETAT
jgi:hypothetical protein